MGDAVQQRSTSIGRGRGGMEQLAEPDANCSREMIKAWPPDKAPGCMRWRRNIRNRRWLKSEEERRGDKERSVQEKIGGRGRRGSSTETQGCQRRGKLRPGTCREQEVSTSDAEDGHVKYPTASDQIRSGGDKEEITLDQASSHV
jgi:hypothetical protein